MDTNLAATIVLGAARELAREHPGKSIFLSVYASIYNTPASVPDVIWTGSVGHTDCALSGRTLAELLTAIRAVEAPQSKLKEAAELRRQAEALEHEARMQDFELGVRLAGERMGANAQLKSIPPQELVGGLSIGPDGVHPLSRSERERILRMADEQDAAAANRRKNTIPPQEQPHA